MSDCDRSSNEHDFSDSDFSADFIAKDLSDARQAKKQLEYKYQLLEQRYQEELSTFDDAKVANIFKNSGAKDYFENINKRIKVKDELVKTLQHERESLKREVDSLQARCKLAEKLRDQYYESWRGSEAKYDRLIGESAREHSIKQERMLNDTSPALSFDASHSVPPPPLIEMPSLDEILKTDKSTLADERPSFTSANNSQYTNLNQFDSPIPPPPPINVSIDEILGRVSSPHGSVYSNDRRY